MEYLGYFFSILIGVVLGIVGSGGSILTIPVLVYLFSIDMVLATTYSLLIVGVTSAIGSLSYLRQNLVSPWLALLFGIPSVISVIITRAYLLPALPDTFFQIGEVEITKQLLLLLVFAVLMLFAALSMIRPSKRPSHPPADHVWRKVLIVAQGLLLGLLTGLVGAGGGFLIIPALVLLQGVQIKKAVGTSLVIIAANALVGFAGTHDRSLIDWPFLWWITGLAVAGIFIGATLAKKINPLKLKQGFGWFVLLMGTYIILKEIFF